MKSGNQAVDNLVKELSQLKQIEGIMLGGSRTSGNETKDSDYDIYIYTSKEIPIKDREKILKKHCSYIELNNQYWETDDDCILKKTNTPIELIYRDLNWITNHLHTLLTEHKASIGYTTCLWHNFIHSQIYYDKSGKLKKIQSQYSIPFPKQLKINIINKNYPILSTITSSYLHQIKLGIKRQDYNSINHRITAFLSSYFDILFAINHLTHPGEKRILEHLKLNAKTFPQDFPSNVIKLINTSPKQGNIIVGLIDIITHNLEITLKKKNLL